MSCILNMGYSYDCSSIGGVSRVWLGTYNNATTYVKDADDVVTSATNGPSIYIFDQDSEFAGVTQNFVVSEENRTVFTESILTMKFTDLTKELRNTVLTLAKAPLIAIVESNAGETYILGVEKPGRMSEGTLSLGVAMGDMNGATVSLKFKSQNGLYLMDSTMIDTDFPVLP